MAKHQVYASLEGIKKNMWRSNLQGFFEINGRPLSDSEVRKLIEYGISKGYKDNSCFTDEDIKNYQNKDNHGEWNNHKRNILRR